MQGQELKTWCARCWSSGSEYQHQCLKDPCTKRATLAELHCSQWQAFHLISGSPVMCTDKYHNPSPPRTTLGTFQLCASHFLIFNWMQQNKY
eukprot:4097843-Amphidinium_carterae.1